MATPRFTKQLELPKTEQAPVVGQTVLPGAKAKADQEQALLSSVLNVQISEAAQLYRNGIKMMDCGEATARSYRQKYEDMPLFGECLDKSITMIENEQRLDYKANTKALRIDNRGVLQGVNGGLIPTGNGLTNLASFGPDAIEPSLRYNVNAWLGDADRTLMFRTRNPNPDHTRSWYATVSEKYSKFDLDDACKALRGVMPKDCHGEIDYDGSRWTITAVLSPTFEVNELGVGRMLRTRVKVTGADDRSKGLKAVFQAERIRCVNCSTITTEGLTFKRRHIGEIADLFSEAISHQGEAMDAFSKAWREANEKAIVDKGTKEGLDPAEIFRRLIAHGYLTIPGFSGSRGAKDGGGAKGLVSRLMECYEKEPVLNAAGINMAITRLAHEQASAWKSPWVTEEIERQAGDLLFQHVYSLPQISDKQAEIFA